MKSVNVNLWTSRTGYNFLITVDSLPCLRVRRSSCISNFFKLSLKRVLQKPVLETD